ncbi:PP2C family protein-serine/threonine phosphatase [Streptomyces sp. KR80]|uniref:PP2C family protein-serine/threonine phosphatase n=1 Tax=Streptomyces sp. KR80 TaxID=3457426 RepID=UPI003FD2A763
MRTPSERGPAARLGNVRLVRLLPAVLLTGGVLLDYFTPPEISGEAFYSAAPMAAAPFLSLRWTVLVGIGACLADTALLAHFGYLGEGGGNSELGAVATVSGIAVVINRILYRSDVRLRSARTIAHAMQRAVLPRPPARIGCLLIGARYEAAHADARVGGDLYAVQNTPYGVRCLVGDVRGKGLEAVEVVNVVLGAFRVAAAEEPTAADVAARLDRALTRDIEQRSGVEALESFITAVLAEFTPAGDEVRLVNRGHPAPLLLSAATVRTVEPADHGLPLGLSGLGPAAGSMDTVRFPDGATLLLCTDGVTEARDRAGTFYDPAARLAGRCYQEPEALLDSLLADVNAHTGGRSTDDLALLAVTRTAGLPEVN